MKNKIQVVLAVLLATSHLAGVSPKAFAQDGVIKIDGSSTVFPITEAVAEEYQKSKAGKVKVTVGISGTGGGFKKFCRAETDISNASRPILQKEIDACVQAGIQFIELPVAFDALTVVINPKNDWASKMTVAELKKIWEPAAQGKITKWNQVNPAWPDRALKLYGAGSDSGTFDYFTEAIVGKSKSSRGDYTASEDDNVLVQGVSGDIGGLGYFGLAYYEENKNRLNSVAVSHQGKSAVAPSLDTVMNGTYQPLARPIFIYVNKKSAKRPEIKEFIELYLKSSSLVNEVKYVPLTAGEYQLALDRFTKLQAGTAFGGKSVIGVRVADILKKKPSL